MSPCSSVLVVSDAATAAAKQNGLGKLVVRRTFLDLDEDVQPTITRATTDSLLCKLYFAQLGPLVAGEEPAEHSDAGEASDTSTCSAVPRAAWADVAVEEPHEEATDCSDGGELSETSLTNKLSQPAVSSTAKPSGDARTTLMLRNLPNNYTRQMLLELLDEQGFARAYDFVYLPIDFARSCGLGYAFVNLATPDWVPKLRKTFDGFKDWAIPSSKVCQVTFSNPHQGLKANVKRYANSPLMHPSVPDEFKPVLFKDGVRVPFPATRRQVCRPQKRK